MHDLPENIQATTQGQSHRGWVTPPLCQTQHCNVLRVAYLKTSGQQQKVIHTGLGIPHTRSNSTMQRVTRDLPENIQATTQGQPHRGWVPPALGQTQHYNVLHTAYLKTSGQRWKVIHTGVGYPPHLVKLNTISGLVRRAPYIPTYFCHSL